MTRRLFTFALLALAVVGLTRCGGSSDPKQQLSDAQDALQKKDYADALKGFDAVIAGEADDKTKFRAARDRLVCVAEVDGETAFQDALGEFSDTYSDSLDVDTLATIGDRLAQAKKGSLALQVIEAADPLVGAIEDETLRATKKAQLATLADQLAKSGTLDDSEMAKLKSLGYLGD